MLGDVRLQAGQPLGGVAERQLGLGQLLDGGEADLFQPAGLEAGEAPIGEVGEGWAPPQGQGLLQGVGGGLRLASLDGLPASGEQLLETVRVHLSRIGLQHIPRLPAPQAASRLRAELGEAPSETGHQALHAGAGREPLTPELLHDRVEGNHAVEVDDEHGQQRSLLGASDHRHPCASGDLERTQQAELKNLMLRSREHWVPPSGVALAAAYDTPVRPEQGNGEPRQ